MRIALLVLSIFIGILATAQTDSTLSKKQFTSIAGNYANGNILPTTPFVKGENLMGKPLSQFQSFTVKALRQNPGYTKWQKIYKAPYYGLGLSMGDFYNPHEIGHPISIFGILGIPIKRWAKLEVYSEFQFGVACNWNYYDPISNPKNHVIGGSLTVHLKAGVLAFYPLTKYLDLGAALSFIHFSNGGFERPNRGFNIYAPSIELKYHFTDRADTRSVKPPKHTKQFNSLYFMLGYGDHQLNEHELDTNYFAIGGLSAIYFTQLSNAFRLGYGADLNYWWGLNARPDGTPGPQNFENLTLGILLQPEFIIDRLTLVSGIGIYATHSNFGNFRQTYQRLGVRYNIYKDLSFGINVRSVNFMLAEFLEFNVGYKISWEK